MNEARNSDLRTWQCTGLIVALTLIAMLRVFAGAASFPFFNHVDEINHVDNLFKIERGEIPISSRDTFDTECWQVFSLWNSPGYTDATRSEGLAGKLPGEYPEELRLRYLAEVESTFSGSPNPQCSQPPVYYVVAGGLFAAARGFGADAIGALYVARFLNALLFGLAVWGSFLLTRRLVPDRSFLYLGVPALLTVFPQDIFYGINNDGPATCLFVFGLLALQRAREPAASIRTCLGGGLLVALAFLVKPTHVTLLVIAVAWLAPAFWAQRRDCRAGVMRRAISLCLGAGLPVVAWFTWLWFANGGDMTGLEHRASMSGSTRQDLDGMLQHPLFTAAGTWTFVSHLLRFFWHGELQWDGHLMVHEAMAVFYVWSTLLFCSVGIIGQLVRPIEQVSRAATVAFAIGGASGVALLAFMSISYSYEGLAYPSKEFPYFVSGRLLIGLLVPFLFIYLDGLRRCLSFGPRWLLPTALGVIITAIVVSETLLHLPVVDSQHNFWNLHR